MQRARLMSWAAYRGAPPRPPLRLRWAPSRGGELHYLGVCHTFAPDDPQIAWIRQIFESLEPHVVLNEGGDPPPLQTASETIARHGEAGFLAWLAQHHGVPRRTLEPDPRAEAATLTGRFASADVKLFFLLRDGLSARRALGRTSGAGSEPAALEETEVLLLENLRRKRGLLGPPNDSADLERALRARLPGVRGWFDVPDAYLDPALLPADTGGPSWLAAIARASSRLRDRWMARYVAGATRRGRRVLAVVGHTHVALQRPLLQAAAARDGTTTHFDEAVLP